MRPGMGDHVGQVGLDTNGQPVAFTARRSDLRRDRYYDVALGTADLDRADACHACRHRAMACPYPWPASRVSTATASAMSLSPLLMLHPR